MCDKAHYDDLVETINVEVDKVDKGMRHLGNRLDDQATVIEKMSSETHDTRMMMAETKVMVGAVKELVERDHTEGREEHSKLWNEVDSLKASKNRMYGIVTGISLMIGAVFSVMKWLW